MEPLVTFGLGVMDLDIVANQNEQMLNRRIDQEIDRVNEMYSRIDSAIDSRLDKLETRITNNKQVLKG